MIKNLRSRTLGFGVISEKPKKVSKPNRKKLKRIGMEDRYGSASSKVDSSELDMRSTVNYL